MNCVMRLRPRLSAHAWERMAARSVALLVPVGRNGRDVPSLGLENLISELRRVGTRELPVPLPREREEAGVTFLPGSEESPEAA
jgi:hypothetical protein